MAWRRDAMLRHPAGAGRGAAPGGWVYAAHGRHAALLVGMLLPAWIHEALGHAAARQSA